jgi:hypothetical protein
MHIRTMTTTNSYPVEIQNGNGRILATAVRGDRMGFPVVSYYDADGKRVFGKVIACPFYGPEPRREFYTCACGFRRERGFSGGVHAGCK